MVRDSFPPPTAPAVPAPSAARRSFLKTAAAGAVAAGNWPGAHAADGTSRTLNLAVVGGGGQGRYVLGELSRAYKQSPDVPGCRVVAVCDVDADRLRDLARDARDRNREAGLPEPVAAFADYHELLRKTGDLDAVLVATPGHQHAGPAVAACDAGLAVYCEKPLANSEEDCDAILAAADRNGTVFQVGTHERSNPRVRRACELVRGGVLGELREIILHLPTAGGHHRAVKRLPPGAAVRVPPASLDYDAWLGDAAERPAAWPEMNRRRGASAGPHFWWRFKHAFGGGELTDRGAHVLDIAQLATGRDDADDWRPTALTAAGAVPDGFYDAVLDYEFALTFPSGPKYLGTTAGERGVRFVGEAGELFVAVHGGKLAATPAAILDADAPETLGRVPSHHANFLTAAAGRAAPTAPTRAGHRTAVLCHRINATLRA